MKNIKVFNLTLTLVLFSFISFSQSSKKSISDWKENIPPVSKYLNLKFEEDYHKLGHNSEPWETTQSALAGDVWFDDQNFLKLDSLTTGNGKTYVSKIEIRDEVAMRLAYGEKEIRMMTQSYNAQQLLATARYSPVYMYGYFVNHEQEVSQEFTKEHGVYSMSFGIDTQYLLKLFVNLESGRVDKITYLSYDELYGNVVKSFTYQDYELTGAFGYPTKIVIASINGNVKETVLIKEAQFYSNDKDLLETPEGYYVKEDSEAKEPQISSSKYAEHIYFIDLAHTEDRVLVVEFDTYVLVAEAPINSENGELIIAEVKKLIPNKPIKYFVFGHHHPHYLGGLRAFVHEDATIICTDISEEYVKTIATASHSLHPDKLEVEPVELKTILLKDSLTLGDNEEMIIYFMGDKSEHTKDYLIYYFPKEKLLFQDDLCWIPTDGQIKKARGRQIGLYNIIESLDLSVETVVQSWPVGNDRVKTIIPFKELEESVKLANEK